MLFLVLGTYNWALAFPSPVSYTGLVPSRDTNFMGGFNAPLRTRELFCWKENVPDSTLSSIVIIHTLSGIVHAKTDCVQADVQNPARSAGIATG